MSKQLAESNNINPLISVIVPVYNSEKFLNKCIESLINQTYKNIELIFVNDGSTDNSLSIIKEYSDRDNRIKVFSKKNGGVSSARNFGLSVINETGYVMFVDSDDNIDKNYIEKFVSKILTNTDLVVELPQNASFFINNSLNKVELFTFLTIYPEFRGPYRKLIKNSIAKNVTFDENIYVGEDLVFDTKVFLKQNNCNFVENGGYNWTYNSESLTHQKNKKNSLVRYKRVFDTCYTWYISFKLLNEVSFFQSESLRCDYNELLCSEYLEFYGSSFKYSRVYKYDSFLDMIDINKKFKLFKSYMPTCRKQKIKKILFCYFRPLYKMIRTVFKLFEND